MAIEAVPMKTREVRYPKVVRAFFLALMVSGIWFATFGLHATFNLIAGCLSAKASGSRKDFARWLIAGSLLYLVARIGVEVIALTFRGIGTGRVFGKNNPRSVLRQTASAELIVVFFLGIGVIAATHGCRQCVTDGRNTGSCDAEIWLRIMSMIAAVWVMRCLRITGYPLAPTKQWM